MARRGAMAKNPPLRGEARREFRQAQREAVASGGPMPTQEQFRPKPQPPQRRPAMPQFNDSIQAGMQAGTLPTDRMYRFPQQYGQGMGEAVGAAVQGMEAQQPYNAFDNTSTNLGGFRNEIIRNPYEPRNDTYWFQGKPNMPGYMGMQAGNAAMPEPDFQTQAMPQMPQPSANQGGKYRLSPGVYGTKEQAMNQWAKQPAMPMLRKG